MKDDLKKLKKVLRNQSLCPPSSETPGTQAPGSDPDEGHLFFEAVKGVKPLIQDKVTESTSARLARKQPRAQIARTSSSRKQLNAEFSFSDIYQAIMPAEGPVRYCREDVPAHSLKRLRRGDFCPELVLDLHGLTREQTKAELAALLSTANKQNIDCVSVMHGLGQGILKQALPHYLVQHPYVLAFHQAPLEYGGQGALLVLVQTAASTAAD